MIAKLKLVLAAGSALAILAGTGVAFGDNNKAVVNQNGSDNIANIAQSGAFNVVGSESAGFDAYQNGDHNTLTITQRGNGNTTGVNGAASYTGAYGGTPLDRRVTPETYRNKGIDQLGDYNSLSVTQVEGSAYNNGNAIGTIWQRGTNNAGGTTNALTIVQDNGNGAGDPGTPYPANYPNDQAYNVVGDIHQDNTGPGGLGLENAILIGQHTNHVDGYAHNNRVDIITQVGIGNDITLEQIGIGNIVNRVEQNGVGGGTLNSVSIGQKGGNFNWVGTVSQNGARNEVEISQLGSSNEVQLLQQFGTRNEADIKQSGVGNVVVSLVQDNTGSASPFGNNADLSFHGDDNGIGGPFTGAALSVGLGVATVSQLGDNNELTYDVTSNSNLFAFSQSGTGNIISGSTSGGDVNQVAIEQLGSSNGAYFAQVGGSNNLAILQ